MLDTAIDSPPALAEPSDLLSQLVTGPSLHEVAATALRQTLGEALPALTLDPDLTMVGTPTWSAAHTPVVAGATRFESLTDTLIRHAIVASPVTFIDGEHFLTLQPTASLPVQLPVNIEAIGRLLNALVPLLFTAWQEQQLDYWNKPGPAARPRWQDLSGALQTLWNVGRIKSWDTDQQALARLVFSYPEQVTRQAHDPYQTRVCLVDLDQRNGSTSQHLHLLDTAVVIGKQGSRTLILTHSIASGFHTFDSFEALGKFLGRGAKGTDSEGPLEWRLFEPHGNFFDTQACTLIALLAEAIGDLDFTDPAAAPLPHRLGHGAPHKDTSTRFNRIDQLLPDWLKQASPGDLSAYSRHLMDLAGVRQSNTGTSFEQDIPPIDRFALDAIALLMQKKHPDAKDLHLKDLRITITTPVVWGTLATGASETVTLTLAELALENLIAVPLGDKKVFFSNATAVPDWLTVSYLEELITTVNVGKTYPARLKDRLLDDPIKSVHLQTLYTRQLRVQLPLLTLQGKIRRESDITDLGYRYVVAVMAPDRERHKVDGQDIVIRPLAFIPQGRTDGSADTVTNMFVIGPRHQDQGPCLLYRPLMDKPLIQYPSTANLIYAIKHSKDIRQSVLAWLPDSVRADYANYIFHGELPGLPVLSELLSNPLLNVYRKGLLGLGTQALDGDYLPALFKANANALIELADRDSVSNAESHWATLKQGAWKLFNAVLPFLTPTLGTAAWIWQILDDLQQALEAREDENTDLARSALTDLFLTLGMVLAHRAAMHGNPARRLAQTKSFTQPKITEETQPLKKIPLIQREDISASQLPIDHQQLIHFSGALNRSPLSLSEALRGMAISKPEGLGEPSDTPGPHQYLYTLGGKFYAPVGKRWFEVQVDEQGEVQIIDSREQPTRSGPLLRSYQKGRWVVDTRLRLRGGGLKSERARIERENAHRVVVMRQLVQAFYERLDPEKAELIAARYALANATEDTRLVRRNDFLKKLDERYKSHDAVIGYLKKLNQTGEVNNYKLSMIELLKSQLFFNETWIIEKDSEFTRTLEVTLDLLRQEEQGIRVDGRGPYRDMIELTTQMIERIEMAHSRFLELRSLGREAAAVILEYSGRLPRYDLLDMKSLRVTLSREFCVKEGTSTRLDEVREHVDRLFDDAGLAIQNSIDLQGNEGQLSAAEHIDALNTLVDQFARIDSSFRDLPQQFAGELVQEQVDLTQERISEFARQSTLQLAQLLLERQSMQEPVPGPSRKPPPKQVIKTRYKGTQFTIPRKTAAGHEKLSDVKSATGKVLATFHEKQPNDWVQRRPQKPLGAQPVQSLSSLIRTGQNLLDALPAFLEGQKKRVSDANRLPVEVEEALVHRAAPLTAAMASIDSALAAGPSSQEQSRNAAALKQKLKTAVTDLTEQGHRLRVDMTKRQLPTAARVEWLYEHQEAKVVPLGERRPLKGPKKDYLQEYQVLDQRTGKVLWYAHFHYPQPDTVNESFSAAHLKTKEQRLLGGAYNLQSATSSPEVIAIYRSEIGLQMARTLFFPTLSPAPDTES